MSEEYPSTWVDGRPLKPKFFKNGRVQHELVKDELYAIATELVGAYMAIPEVDSKTKLIGAIIQQQLQKREIQASIVIERALQLHHVAKVAMKMLEDRLVETTHVGNKTRH